MVDRKELDTLAKAMRERGAVVHIYKDTKGAPAAVAFANVPTIAPGCWGVWTAAEMMRDHLRAA